MQRHAFSGIVLRGLATAERSRQPAASADWAAAGESRFLAQRLGMLNELQDGGSANQRRQVPLAPGAVVFILNVQRWLDDPSWFKGSAICGTLRRV